MSGDSHPPQMLSAPLRLTAMTLRGLGPYLHGERLEIKPLTILCGANGSGKSTWLETMRLLKLTASKRTDFPLCDEWYPTVSWDARDPDGKMPQYGSWIERVALNAHLVSTEQGGTRTEKKQQSDEANQRRNQILDSRQDEDISHGPAGCIGLELSVVREQAHDELPSLLRPTKEVDVQTPAQRLLWLGQISPGSRIRLRLARPFESYNKVVEGLKDLVELTLDGKFTLRLERPHERDWSPSAGGGLKYSGWTFSCSEAFLSDDNPDENEPRALAYLILDKSEDGGHPLNIDRRCEGCSESVEMIERLAENFCRLFRHLIQQTLAGFFPVGPIREVHHSEICRMAPDISSLHPLDYGPATRENCDDDDEQPFEKIRPDLRFVGERGENTQELFGYWAYNLMTQFGKPSMQYWFETFVSYWLNELTQTRIELAKNFTNGRPDLFAIQGNTPLNGTMENSVWNWEKEGPFAITFENAPNSERAFIDFSRSLLPSSSELTAGWHVMSTGFHQLAPIIVQSALLRQNEIMAVENPEAHLHPSLQIKVAQFLMYQATAGKIMLVETHSDLVVRRILRAIREEQLSVNYVFKQSSVGINFTSVVDDDPNGFKYAKVEELQIDDKGQVHNWPAGFMDDDLKEADRWMQANFRSEILDESSDE